MPKAWRPDLNPIQAACTALRVREGYLFFLSFIRSTRVIAAATFLLLMMAGLVRPSGIVAAHSRTLVSHMAKYRFYAVAQGRQPGVYSTW